MGATLMTTADRASRLPPAQLATQNSGSRAFARLPLFHSQHAGAVRLKPHGARPWLDLTSGLRAQPDRRGAVVGEVFSPEAPNNVVVQLRPEIGTCPLLLSQKQRLHTSLPQQSR